jgi:hypothetical protein
VFSFELKSGRSDFHTEKPQFCAIHRNPESPVLFNKPEKLRSFRDTATIEIFQKPE